MSPANWVAIVLGVVVVGWIVAWFDDVANGTSDERKAYREKCAKDDAEAMLTNANQEVNNRPRIRAGTHK